MLCLEWRGERRFHAVPPRYESLRAPELNAVARAIFDLANARLVRACAAAPRRVYSKRDVRGSKIYLSDGALWEMPDEVPKDSNVDSDEVDQIHWFEVAAGTPFRVKRLPAISTVRVDVGGGRFERFAAAAAPVTIADVRALISARFLENLPSPEACWALRCSAGGKVFGCDDAWLLADLGLDWSRDDVTFATEPALEQLVSERPMQI
jgi:hypothetical protein